MEELTMPIDKAKIEEWTRLLPEMTSDERRAFAVALLAEREEIIRERDRHERGAEEFRASLMSVRRELGLMGGGTALSDVEEVHQVVTQRAAALSVLREVGWRSALPNAPAERICPWCCARREDGHQDDCRLASLLR